MGGVIWLIVIVYIVVKVMKNGKNSQNTAKPNVQKQKTQVNRPSQPVRAVQPNQPARPPQPNYSNRQQQPSHSNKQQRPPKQSAPTENSILQKAKQHAQAQFEDDTIARKDKPADLTQIPLGDEIMKDKAKARHIHSEHDEHSHDTELRNQAGVDDLDTYHLIDEINDLIVKGYSGELNFERDFIAEGMDMLNRISG